VIWLILKEIEVLTLEPLKVENGSRSACEIPIAFT
jgi:hypothetical protein